MIFDIVFLVFIAIGFYQGYKNGIIYSIFSILGWFLGIVAALKFSYLMVNLLHGFAHLSPKTLAIIAFVLVLAIVVGLMKLIAWGLEQILKSFSMNLFNQIFGGILHSLIGLYVLCVFIWFLDRLDVSKVANDMDLPGYKFHQLKGKRKGVFAVSVSGNLRVTFEFKGDDAINVDLEDYH